MSCDALTLEGALDEASPDRPRPPKEWLAPARLSRLFSYALVDWACIAAAWALAARFPLAYPLILLITAGRFHSLGVILHDLAHLPLKEKTPAVRALEILVGYPVASTLNAMRYHHLRHHRDSGLPTDPYFKEDLLSRPIYYRLLGAALVPFWILRPGVGLAAWAIPDARNFYGRFFLQDRSGEDLSQSPELIECAREELGQAIFWGFIIAVAIAHPHALALNYLLPLDLAAVLANHRLLGEHTAERTHDRKTETIIRTTNDQYLGISGALFLAPRNVGCHIVHHLHPVAPLYRLRELRAWYLEKHPTP